MIWPVSSSRRARACWTAAGSSGCSAGATRGRYGTRSPLTATPTAGSARDWNPTAATRRRSPPAIELALGILDEADAWDEGLVAGACDWLQANAPAEGGSAFVAATIDAWPHAPWWVPELSGPASLVSTGQIAGTLHARGVSHPWLDRATGLMWSRIETLTGTPARTTCTGW